MIKVILTMYICTMIFIYINRKFYIYVNKSTRKQVDEISKKDGCYTSKSTKKFICESAIDLFHYLISNPEKIDKFLEYQIGLTRVFYWKKAKNNEIEKQKDKIFEEIQKLEKQFDIKLKLEK